MLRIPLIFAVLLFATDVSAQDATLRAGSSVRASLSIGDTLSYALDTDADYFVLGAVDQISVDVVVRILRPDGRVVRTIDGPARGLERFYFETQLEGDYRIEVIPLEEEAGDFVISLERLEPVETDPRKLADQLMSPYDRADSPGAVVSVFRDGETIFARAYGMANLSYHIPFEVDTRTNIGSTSKQFTAFAVMLLVERGELSLDDDIRKHLPELPDLGETVTVRHILTHTSGLREFLNILRMAGRRLDHGDFIDRRELIEIVQRQPALQNSPGAEWNYNNTAFGLAAAIVERVSGQAFHVFMQENVFGPLDMTRTMVRPSPEHIVEDRSEGYTPAGDGTYREVGDLGGAVGAGGIYTTVGDLQKWVENFSKAEVGSHAIFEQMMTSYVLTNGEATGYGLGLSIDEQGGLKRVQHGGSDVAHRSMLAYYPEINAGITTQSNHARFNSRIAFRLAEAFFRDDMEFDETEADSESQGRDPVPDEAEEEWAPTDDELPAFTGRYFSEELEAFFTVTSGDDGLTLHQRRMDDMSLSSGELDIFSGGGFTLSFERERNGQVIAFYMSNGRTRDVRFALMK